MDVLCAGPAGRLTLVPAVVDPESDALFTRGAGLGERDGL